MQSVHSDAVDKIEWSGREAQRKSTAIICNPLHVTLYM